MCKYLFRWTLPLLLGLPLYSQSKLSVSLEPPDRIETRLKDFPALNPERQQRALDLFREMDCPKIVTVPLGKKPYPANIVCILPGENQRAILVGAHYDKTPSGEGKLDNASGTVLLSSLFLALRSSARKHTYIFVAFAEEEDGLIGSRALAAKGFDGQSGKEFLASLAAMVNIDSVGAGPTSIALSQSDEGLAQIALAVAKAIDAPCRLMNVDKGGDSDGSSFRSRKVRTIQFHSLDDASFKLLHSDRDNMKAIQAEHYGSTYKLIALYLAQLDISLTP